MKAALRIRQIRPAGFRQAAAHPTIDKPTRPRHRARVLHSIANNERRGGLFCTFEKGWNVFCRMLAVAIERQRPSKIFFSGMSPSLAQRRSLSEIPTIAQYCRSGGLRPGGRLIYRTIV